MAIHKLYHLLRGYGGIQKDVGRVLVQSSELIIEMPFPELDCQCLNVGSLKLSVGKKERWINWEWVKN